MKVLIASEDVPYRPMGGLAKHALTLANALIREGHTVDFMGNNLFSQAELKDDMYFSGKFVPELNLKHTTWKENQLGFFNYYRRDFMARRFARAILRRAHHFDVVHYHGHVPILANYIPVGVNFVQTRHDQGGDCLIQTRFRNHDICHETSPLSCAQCAVASPSVLQTALSGMSVSRFRKETADAFKRHKTIFVSQFLRENSEKFVGSCGGRSYVVHNFVDYARIKRVVSDTQPRSSEFLEILIVSTLYEPKGVGAFLGEIVGKLEPGVRISVIGAGVDAEELRRQYENERVVFLGWRRNDEVLQYAANCDVLVVPSLCEEAFGTTTLEGLALGKPTYALRRGATPELSIYERYNDQLKLFNTMPDLAAAVVAANSKAAYKMYGSFDGDVHSIIPRLVEIYNR